MIEDFVLQLQQWSEQHTIIAAALASCQIALQHSAREDEELDFLPLNGWRLEHIHTRFEKQALVFRNEHLRGCYVDTTIELYVESDKDYYFEGRCVIGYYRQIVDLNAQPVDDYLVLDVAPQDVPA